MINLRKTLTAAGSALGAAALVLAPTASAIAAEDQGPGYVRFAHLSPDTVNVDLTLTALAGDSVVYQQGGIGYGAVSEYIALDPGTYAIAMVPAGEPSDAPAVLSGEIEIETGGAATVAGIDYNEELQTLVIDDDFAAPSDGSARLRVVQASASSSTVDVSTGEGTELAGSAELGDIGEYVDVPAGPTELNLVSDDAENSADMDLAAGSVHTAFVIDDADGQLVVVSGLDAASASVAPIGGVETGGGALAQSATQAQTAATLTGVGVIAMAALAAILLRFRRGATERA